MKWPAPLRKLLSSSRTRSRLGGHLDRLESRRVAGWAADHADFEAAVLVLLVADGRPVGLTRAERMRADLKLAGIGEGRHGYEFEIPDLRRRGVRRIETYALRTETAARLGLANGEGRFRAGIDPKRFAGMIEARHGGIVLLGGVDVPQSVGGPLPIYARRETGPIALLDVYDLLAFLEQRRRVTGIQRVVAGLIQTADPTRHPAFEFCIPSDDASILVLPLRPLTALVEKALTGTAELEELRADVAALRVASERIEIRAGDRYVLAGAYWTNPDCASTLLHLRAQGVIIGAYVYDLIPFAAPRYVPASTRAAVVDAFALCDFFLTISAFVESQLAALLAGEAGRRPPTRAVKLPHEPPGGADGFVPAGPAHPRPYVLCVGTLEGRKNHLLLFEVWAALIRRHGVEAVPDLVLVGNWGSGIAEFQERCHTTGFLQGRIIVRQDVSDGELLVLYRGCLLTTFPSFLEGWGLPVGESLAVGKLCIASNASSVPEVGGAFADYVDPHDHLRAVSIFERAIFEPDHRTRREREIAARFKARTWEETSNAFHEAVAALASAAPRRRVPLLRESTSYRFENLMDDDLVSWDRRLARLALAEGWHPLEAWGAWSSRPDPIVRFFTRAVPGEEVIVTLSLVPPPGIETARVRLEGGAEGGDLFRPGEVDVVARVGQGGEVVLPLRSDPAAFHAEGLRDLHVGLAGLEFRRKPN